MGSHKVQSFQAGDEEEIVRVFEAAFGESDYYFPRSVLSWIWRYMHRPGFDSESILMIRKEDTLVAALSMTYATMNINGEPKKVALIDDVSTLPHWQKRGFATTLMKHAIARAQEVGCWGIHLSANPDGSAIQIYKSAGFEIITHCINMMSILQYRRAARFGKRRHAIPLLALSTLEPFRALRIDKNQCEVNMADGNTAYGLALRAQKEFTLQNGRILLNEAYIRWMTGQRPDGTLKVASITKDDRFSGILTVSSSDFSGPGATDRMAVIGNLSINEAMQTKNAIAAALHGAKGIAKNTLNCPMVNIFVDSRAKALRAACKKAGFMEVGKSVSMVHTLGQSQKLVEIKEGIWNQPVETSSSNP